MGGERGGERSWVVRLVGCMGRLWDTETSAIHNALGTYLNGRARAGTWTVYGRDGYPSVGRISPGIQPERRPELCHKLLSTSL